MSLQPVSARPPAASLERLGRFELTSVLGKGAQATVWLAFDPRLERNVAVKLMHEAGPDDGALVDHWLQEARHVSRLTHPNIVPVFEADVHERRPYLVFEYVAGRTLAEQMREQGAPPVSEAIALISNVLDALQAAHEAGVVHRDLKPSNILVDTSGRARVMDFGIAARLQQNAQESLIVGTPGYMSPEAATGAAPAAVMDVFAAGLVLAEMLCGTQLVREKDPYRALYRLTHEDLQLPASVPPEVDDDLRAIVMRAIARNPARRWSSAAEFLAALQTWQKPSAPVATTASGGNGTLDFLLRRMRHKSDFPALSGAVTRIERFAQSEKENLFNLSNEILKDVALTNKLLRMVNTAYFSQRSGDAVSTVSRAVALVGFAGIRSMALSLVLLEHMQDKAHANQLKDQFLRSLMAGSIAGEMGSLIKDGEEAFIAAMFQNLGRLLTEYYFPEEARQVRALLAAGPRAGGVSEASASISVLGLSFQDLGLGVANSWGLPESLRRCMSAPTGEPPKNVPHAPGERLRWLALTANQITDTMLNFDGEAANHRIDDVAQRSSGVLGLSPRQIRAATETGRQRLVQLAQAMHLQVTATSPARRLLSVSPAAPLEQHARHEDSLAPHQLQATVAFAGESAAQVKPIPTDVMASGIRDITNTMVGDFKLNEVLRMVLETMFRAFEFRRVVFCLKDAKADMLTGRFGLGVDVETLAHTFKVPLKGGSDLFSAVCQKLVDTLISDAQVSNIAARLPDWFVRGFAAPTFLLLPLQLKGSAFGLIYADKAAPGSIEMGEKELSMLRTLRNQAVMAFKQTG